MVKIILTILVVGIFILSDVFYLSSISRASNIVSDNTSTTIIEDLKPTSPSAILLFDKAFFKIGPSCRSTINTEYITEAPATKPLMEKIYLRIMIVLMEVMALYFYYVKGQQCW